jgi:hypothetical protein
VKKRREREETFEIINVNKGIRSKGVLEEGWVRKYGCSHGVLAVQGCKYLIGVVW